jgi:large subunit ribosomal protein L39
VASGSFIHDVDLKMSDWQPTKQELMVFSAAMHRIAERALPFERLEVDAAVANEMFADNRFKLKQIPSIAANSKLGTDDMEGLS